MIGQEAHLTTLNQSWQSHMLPFLDDYRYAKNFLSGDIDDQGILEFNWTKRQNWPKPTKSTSLR